MNRSIARSRGRRAGLAALVALLAVAGTAPAAATDPVTKVLASTLDVVNLATYEVRTVLQRSDGSRVERTAPAVVGTPTLVDVHGGISAPDLTVSVLPRADRVRLAIDKLPTAPAALPVLVEAVFDLPEGQGAAFGYDQTASTAPRGFTADLLFSILDPPEDSFTLVLSPTGAPASLSVVGELFTRSGTSRLDPKRGRLTVDPVPDQMSFTAQLQSREARGARRKGNPPPRTERDRASVTVSSSQTVHAVISAADHRDTFRRDVVADIRDLPTHVNVTYTDETLESTGTRVHTHQLVDYTANARVGSLDLDVDEFLGEEHRKAVDATVTNLPLHFTADLDNDDGPRLLEPDDEEETHVESRRVDYLATDVVDTATFTSTVFTPGVVPEEVDEQVDARLTTVPTRLRLVNEKRGVNDPATGADERTLHLELQDVSAPLGSLEAGVASDRPVTYLADPEVVSFFRPDEIGPETKPGYASKHGDDIAVRLAGLSRAVVDTADPLTVHAVSNPLPFLVHAVDLTCEEAEDGHAPPTCTPSRTATVNVLDLPPDATVTFSPITQRVTYTGRDAAGSPATVRQLRAKVDSTAALVRSATHAEVLAEGVPSDLELTINPGSEDPPPDGVPITLGSFDAHGKRLDLLEVLLTSDPAEDERLPDDADGVLVRDLRGADGTDDRFHLFGRITGLRSASVTQVEKRGDPEVDPTRVQTFDTTLKLEAPLPSGDQRDLQVDVGRTVGQSVERLVVAVDNRPNSVTDLTLTRERSAVTLFTPPTTSTTTTTSSTSTTSTTLPPLIPEKIEILRPRAQRLNYEADRRADGLVACQRSGAQLPDFDCELLATEIAAAEEPQAAGAQLGVTASIEPLPATLDLCLASDDGDLGRGFEGKNQGVQGADDEEEREPVLPQVDCLGQLKDHVNPEHLPEDVPTVDDLEPALCAPNAKVGNSGTMNLDCIDSEFDDHDLGKRLKVKTALEFDASEVVTINLFDCRKLINPFDIVVEGADGNTVVLFPTCPDFTRVKDLKLQTMRAQFDSPQKTGDEGYAFLDTDDKPITGDVVHHPLLDTPGATKVSLNFPDRASDAEEFKASGHFVAFQAQITGLDGSVDVKYDDLGTCQRGGADIEVKPVVEVKLFGAKLFNVLAPSFELANDFC